MPTQRRLMNKKAYEEVKLLEQRIQMTDLDMEVSLRIVNDREMFVIKDGQGKELFGKTYTEIEKLLTSYMIQKNG